MESKQAMRRMVERRRAEHGPRAGLEPVLQPLLDAATTVASYLPFGSEPGIAPRPGWLLPVLREDDDLDWTAYDGRLVTGRRGLSEPAGTRLGVEAVGACDLVLVPALLVDRQGHRLGKGGGSYDRALRRTTGLTVALLHDDELVDTVPVESHDVPVSAAATPALGVVCLTGRMRTMGTFDDLLVANAAYERAFTDDSLPGRAGKGLAVVTCMDSRIEPLRMLGLEKGDAKILRNGGGRVTDDVLRTLVLATHLLGVDRVLIVEHTDCKMATSTAEQVHQGIFEASGVDTRSLDFRLMDDQLRTLAQDVQKVRSSPYLPKSIAVGGFLYDVHTGRLREVF